MLGLLTSVDILALRSLTSLFTDTVSFLICSHQRHVLRKQDENKLNCLRCNKRFYVCVPSQQFWELMPTQHGLLSCDICASNMYYLRRIRKELRKLVFNANQGLKATSRESRMQIALDSFPSNLGAILGRIDETIERQTLISK